MLRLPQGLHQGLRLPESVHQSVAAAYSLRRLNFETSVCAILIRLAVPLLRVLRTDLQALRLHLSPRLRLILPTNNIKTKMEISPRTKVKVKVRAKAQAYIQK